jgi:glycosyltransferase involved in cell wall biosynthesis
MISVGTPNATAVAIIAPIPPPLGGMSLQAQALRENLAKGGVRTVIISTNPPLPFALNKVIGLRTFLSTLVYLWCLIKTVPQVSVIHILAASYFYFYTRVIPALLIGRLLGRRVIVNYRGGKAFAFLASHGWLLRPVLRLADLITVPSQYLERCFQEQGFDCKVIGNIVNFDRFQFRRRPHLSPNLLVTRNLEPMYNVRMALQAFELVKQVYTQARLDIVGAGTEERNLKTWAREKRLKDVFFHGAVGNDQIPKYLDRADVLLNPTNVDNLPMNLLEAFASGVPVVSTNVGGVPDLVGNEKAALLVEPGDYRAMAEKVIGLLANPNDAQSLITHARQLAGDFSWEGVREKLLEAYFPKTSAVSIANAMKEKTLESR